MEVRFSQKQIGVLERFYQELEMRDEHRERRLDRTLDQLATITKTDKSREIVANLREAAHKFSPISESFLELQALAASWGDTLTDEDLVLELARSLNEKRTVFETVYAKAKRDPQTKR